MPVEKIDIDRFIHLAEIFPVLDVRSPEEYIHAHIPGAFSVPLFTDEQRKVIGTAYTKESRQVAVDHGLQYFSERMKVIPGEITRILQDRVEQAILPHPAGGQQETAILVHCWRGGMRSEAVAWLLSLYGYQIYVLKGGYKAFRKWALLQFEKSYPLKVLGGYTGSGKTEVLKELQAKGKTIIDLEGLASHKGSAFGSLGEMPQPSHEMFENMLSARLWEIEQKLKKGLLIGDHEIWIEDESIHIGTVGIPGTFWQQMRNSPLYFLEIPFEERVKYLVATYGIFDKQDLINAVLKIQKRLGGLNTKNAIQFLSAGDLHPAFSILLTYYDRMYGESLHNRQGIEALLRKVICQKVDVENAQLLAE